MSRDSLKVHINPYGSTSAAFESLVDSGTLSRRWLRTARRPFAGRGQELFHIWVAFSQEMDEEFVKSFRQHSSAETRLLVMNGMHAQAIDTLFTRLLKLQIRSPQRLYLADCVGNGTTHCMALLQRLTSALSAKDDLDRILDARIESGVLRLVSPEFKRLDVPVAQIPALAAAEAAALGEFEIDEDGSFVYWPKLDVHLGWDQLEQIANPDAVRKARQKHREFNIRYGKAVQRVRERSGLRLNGVPGLSKKQLGRIEKGQCRLTANAIEALSKAHKVKPNEYLQRLADTLD